MSTTVFHRWFPAEQILKKSNNSKLDLVTENMMPQQLCEYKKIENKEAVP